MFPLSVVSTERKKFVSWHHSGRKLHQSDVSINDLFRIYCPNTVNVLQVFKMSPCLVFIVLFWSSTLPNSLKSRNISRANLRSPIHTSSHIHTYTHRPHRHTCLCTLVHLSRCYYLPLLFSPLISCSTLNLYTFSSPSVYLFIGAPSILFLFSP